MEIINAIRALNQRQSEIVAVINDTHKFIIQLKEERDRDSERIKALENAYAEIVLLGREEKHDSNKGS